MFLTSPYMKDTSPDSLKDKDIDSCLTRPDFFCCPNCIGCNKGNARVAFYKTLQENGKYFYVLNTDPDQAISIWENHKPSCYTLNPDPSPDLDEYRSDPRLLAYVDLYRPPNVVIIEGLEFKFMSFKYSGFVEYVDEIAIQTKINENSLRKIQKLVTQTQTMLEKKPDHYHFRYSDSDSDSDDESNDKYILSQVKRKIEEVDILLKKIKLSA